MPRWPADKSKVCRSGGCGKVIHARGLCSGHYQQEGRGEPLKPLRAHGALLSRDNGYVIHSRTANGGRRLMHRVVMEAAIGRALRSDESVHHRNGDRADNRLENLELWSGSHPAGQRIEDKIEWAVGVLALYRPEVLSAEALTACETSGE